MTILIINNFLFYKLVFKSIIIMINNFLLLKLIVNKLLFNNVFPIFSMFFYI